MSRRRRGGLRAQARLWNDITRQMQAAADEAKRRREAEEPTCTCAPGECPDRPAVGWPHGLSRWRAEGRTGWVPEVISDHP